MAWTIEANHGGGYQYRLAPADEPLTEAAFQLTPLPFVGKQRLRWGGPNGKILAFDGRYVTCHSFSSCALSQIRSSSDGSGRAQAMGSVHTFSCNDNFRCPHSSSRTHRRYVSTGTIPAGSTWAQNPIPRNDVQNTGQGFPPYCNTTGALGCQVILAHTHAHTHTHTHTQRERESMHSCSL